MNCKIPVILAYAMAAYSISSMLYIFTTIFTQTGTPLSDKINKDPELKKLEKNQNMIEG